MRKVDIARALAGCEGLTDIQTRKYLETVLEIIKAALISGQNIEIRGFGVWKTKVRKARAAQDICRGKTIQLPGRLAIIFKPSKKLKIGARL